MELRTADKLELSNQ